MFKNDYEIRYFNDNGGIISESYHCTEKAFCIIMMKAIQKSYWHERIGNVLLCKVNGPV